MKTQVSKSGSSLVLTIPQSLADQAQLREGDEVELLVSAPGTMQVRSSRNKLTLEDLLEGATPENSHGETDWGPARGGEVW